MVVSGEEVEIGLEKRKGTRGGGDGDDLVSGRGLEGEKGDEKEETIG